MAKFRKGSYVRLTHDAQEAYQAYPWVDQVLVVTRVATKYMPAAEFFQKGSPNGYSPGYDEDVGGALYDVRTTAGDDVASAFYEWELIKAEAMKIEKQVSTMPFVRAWIPCFGAVDGTATQQKNDYPLWFISHADDAKLTDACLDQVVQQGLAEGHVEAGHEQAADQLHTYFETAGYATYYTADFGLIYVAQLDAEDNDNGEDDDN